MKIKAALLLVAVFVGTNILANAQAPAPADVLRSFFKFHRSHKSEFSKATIDARKRWLSNDLYKLLLNELKREREFLTRNSGEKPFFGEGLPFQPLDETCSAGKRQVHKVVSIRPEDEDREVANVRVTFSFPYPCKIPAPVSYTFEMIRAPSGWVIDNVIFDSGTTLVQDLERKEY